MKLRLSSDNPRVRGSHQCPVIEVFLLGDHHSAEVQCGRLVSDGKDDHAERDPAKNDLYHVGTHNFGGGKSVTFTWTTKKKGQAA